MSLVGAVAVAGAAVGAAAGLLTLRAALLTRTRVPVLRPDLDPAPAPWPRVSVVIPARDEADRIEPAVQSRLADAYPDVEYVLVDDRSTDGTGAVMDRLAAGDPRVRVVHVTELPAGWLSKVHALERGRAAATGDWLLFSDADVEVQRGALRAAVAHAEARGLDFLAVLPRLYAGGVLRDTALSAFGRLCCIGARLWAVADPRSTAFAGVGAWNLVRRSALDATPGFPWLRLEVIDDVALGRLFKLRGRRCGVANGRDLVGLEFYPSLRAMARGLEKNGFAAAGQYSLVRLSLVCGTAVAAEFAPLAALLPGAGPVAAVLAVAAVAGAGAGNALLARVLRRPLIPSLCYPLGTLLVVWMLARAGALASWRGGISWRGTRYGLAELRANARLWGP